MLPAEAANRRPPRRVFVDAGKRRGCIVLLGMLLSAGCLDITGVQLGQLQVQVVDEEGTPVVGAHVEPHGGWYWWDRRAVGSTDRDGRVQFRLPPTTYRVFADPPDGFRHRDPPYWATMMEVAVPEEGASVTLVFARSH